MTQERQVFVEGIPYRVTISDHKATLLAAQAAGRVVVGLLGEAEEEFLPAVYVIQDMETADDDYLERVVRRHEGLPWIIGDSERILVREFTKKDIPSLLAMGHKEESQDIFFNEETIKAYIENQYPFYEYGIWAVIRKSDGVLLGKAGISTCEIQSFQWEHTEGIDTEETRLELGYYISPPYRRQGYALEACSIIQGYVRQEILLPIYAITSIHNTASRKLLDGLGFSFKDQTHKREKQAHCLYEWNC